MVPDSLTPTAAGRRPRLRRVLAVALLVSLGGVPARAADREHRVMMAELRMLQEQNQQLHQMLNGLTEALQALNARLDQQDAATRKALADQRLLIDNLGQSVRVIRERVDETNVRIATLGQDIEALRAATLSAVTPQPGTPAAPDGAVPAPDPNAPPQTGTSPSQLYDLAFGDYTAGQWDLAIQGFQTYLKAYPTSPLAHKAALNIGQAHYSAGRFEDAVAAYDEVIANYEGTESVPEAYYKRGLAYERLGQTDRARESLQVVLDKFPEEHIAFLARQALERLQR